MARRRVYVTGLGAVCGLGTGVAALRDGVRSRCAIGPFALFDLEGHRTKIAGQVSGVPGADPALSRADAFGLLAAAEALGQAGLAAPLGVRAGCFFGSSTGGLWESEQLFARLHANEPFRIRTIASQQNNGPGDAVARSYGVAGPVVTHSSACTSSNVALGEALRAIRAGECDVAIAGGSDSLCQITYAGFNSLRAVDRAPSRPFRASRAGLSLGEGAGVLLVESEEHMRGRGATALAELAGAGASCDAHHMSAPKDDGVGPATAIRAALEDAGLTAEDIAFVNAHGTGTPHNDAVESRALAAVFGERLREIPVTSTKGVVGHLLGACGALEAVVTVLAIQHRELHPTPGAEEAQEELGIDLVTRAPRALPEGANAISTNLAFGGSNSVVCIKAVSR